LALIWGTNFLLVEEALEGLNPTQIVIIRLVSAGAILALLAGLQRIPLPKRGSVWTRLTVMGLIGQAIPWLLFAWGQQTVASALAGVYTGLTPLLTIPVASVLLRKQPTTAEVAASVVGFAGLAVVLAPWSENSSASLVGQLLCLVGAACYAVAYSYAAHIMKTVDESKLALAASQALAASAIMIPVGSGQLMEPMHVTLPITSCLILLGAGTAVAFLVNYWLIARVGPVQASLAFYLIPIVAAVVGILAKNERLSVNEVLGSVLILAALAALYLRERRAPQPNDVEATEGLLPPLNSKVG
ncbi:MAG: DMT family transporter, partial [Pyrinomonadaceae bacterium]